MKNNNSSRLKGRHPARFHVASRALVAAFVAGLLLLTPAIQADTHTWTGLGDGTSWSDGGNWDIGADQAP